MNEYGRKNWEGKNNVIPFISEDLLRKRVDFLEDENNELSSEDRTEKELDLAIMLQGVYRYSIENQNGVIYVVREIRHEFKSVFEKTPVLLKVKRILGDYSLAS